MERFQDCTAFKSTLKSLEDDWNKQELLIVRCPTLAEVAVSNCSRILQTPASTSGVEPIKSRYSCHAQRDKCGGQSDSSVATRRNDEAITYLAARACSQAFA
ncbi:hypothetical protein ElyMa_000164800 [Elysia marginata]|uniref:Uncharacterized protein n=1 Tax=Elysia marginata TaxID=1093978 RepID=A0AAV4ERN9_9GAST|nr:hypothetical protein ElyMa_000164800 [Elysia marginata]